MLANGPIDRVGGVRILVKCSKYTTDADGTFC